jgi:cadmium resistance protein CadD (predicted permease)
LRREQLDIAAAGTERDHAEPVWIGANDLNRLSADRTRRTEEDDLARWTHAAIVPHNCPAARSAIVIFAAATRTLPWVGDLVATIATAVGVFAATNVDDLVIVTVLFVLASRGAPSATTTPRLRSWHVWAGQYLGTAVLVAVSVAAAAGLHVIPDRWVGLLGVVPLGIGLYGLVRAIRGSDDAEPMPVARGAVTVAALTIANGADNVAVYAAVFRTLSWGDTVTITVVFAAGVALMCLAGRWLGSRRLLVAAVERSGRWIVPIVFIVIGTIILLDLASA